MIRFHDYLYEIDHKSAQTVAEKHSIYQRNNIQGHLVKIAGAVVGFVRLLNHRVAILL